jgi:hypothetical protein
MRRAALLAVPLIFAACSGGPATSGQTPSPVAGVVSPTPAESPTASPDQASPDQASPAASPSPTASPIAPPDIYGILVRDFLVDGGATYAINLVRNDGSVDATATAAKRSHPKGILVQMPNLSASGSAVYYLDGDANLRFLRPDGTQGAVKTLPVDASSAAVFAVSPDDRRIAVAIITYPYPAKTRIYVEDLYGTTNHVELFSSSTVMEWPVGWHQGQLVLGVGLNAAPQNAYEGFAYDEAGYHVANPSTGTRLATICANGFTGGPPVPAGTVCRTSSDYSVLDWSGASHSVPVGDQCRAGAVSPDGLFVADFCTNGLVRVVTETGGVTETPYTATPLGWIDRLHVVVVAHSGELSSLNVQIMSITTIQAGGFFAGTVPGSL